MIIFLIAALAIGLGAATDKPKPSKKFVYVYDKKSDGTYVERIVFRKDN